jgi:hypothetical protein
MTTRNGLPGVKKISLSRVAEDAARHEICRALRRVGSRRPLPSSSSLVFRRHRSPFRSPARPLHPNPTLARFCCSGCRNCSTSAATYSQRITRVRSMDSISRTNEHSLLTSYYSSRTTYNIRPSKCQSCSSVRQQQ